MAENGARQIPQYVSESNLNTRAGYKTAYQTGQARKAWVSDGNPNLASEYLSRVRESGGEYILDLASGPANVAIGLARMPESEGLKFICVDSEDEAVEPGKEAVQQAGLTERITMIRGDLLNLSSISELIPYTGRVDIHERHGLTSHADLQDRIRYYHWVRHFIRKEGWDLTTTFSGYDWNFNGYHPIEHEVAEITPDKDDPTYPGLAKYHGIFHKFWRFDQLQDWFVSQGFKPEKIMMASHPRPDVRHERFVMEVLARSVPAEFRQAVVKNVADQQ